MESTNHDEHEKRSPAPATGDSGAPDASGAPGTRDSADAVSESGSDAHAGANGSARAPSGGSAGSVGGPTRSQIAEADPEQAIGLSLTGPMPCISCGYDLQGLSVVGLCPECGAGVRATILAKIDPQAEELAPLLTPRFTAYGLLLGVYSGCAAALLMWFLRGVDAFERFLPLEIPAAVTGPVVRWITILATALPAICALGLVRPVRSTTLKQATITVAGAPCFALAAWASLRIHLVHDLANPPPYFVASPSVDRLTLRLIFTASLVIALLCVRPSARRLARRSMAMRAGRLNRQTVFAMCGALALAALGDLARLLTTQTPPALDDLLDISGTLLILAGSALFTVGALLCAADAARVARILLRPPPSVRQVVAGATTRPSRP